MKEKAFLVDIVPPKTSKEESDLRFEELESLVKTYGGASISKSVQKRSVPDYKTYVGSGKIIELLDESDNLENLDVIIINNILKPRQIYNLEEVCINYQIQKREEEHELNPGVKSRFENPKKIKVWDRVDLILKIFDKHAKTVEAKLQIEKASISHMGPRIFGMGMELSRQAGGIGTIGAGESNIEMMKRHLQKRIKTVNEKLKYYGDIQKRHRDARRNKNLKTVSLVGYTNAGKSTLINALTKKDVYIADELFATLDSRAGELFLPKTRSKAILTDTIGFIQDLPPSLIEAFKSTLAEIVDADLVMHVIDISDQNMDLKIKVVEEILEAIGCGDKEKIYVFNKMDSLDKQVEKNEVGPEEKIELEVRIQEDYGEYNPQFVSAVNRKELSLLIETIEKIVTNDEAITNN